MTSSDPEFSDRRCEFRLLLGMLLVLVLLFSLPSRLSAQNSAALGLTVKIEIRLKLEVNTTFLSFTRSSSSGVPQIIPANEGPFNLVVKTNCNLSLTASVWALANSDLVDISTGYSIEVERVSWQAEGDGFFPGQLSKSTPVLIARFRRPGEYSGSLNFFFAEDPNLAPGTYQTVVTILVEGI